MTPILQNSTKDGERTPVSTLAELDTLDSDEIVEGYMDGFGDVPEPGNNRSKAYWHGWRNAQIDRGRIKPDWASGALATAIIARNRAESPGVPA